MNSCVNYNLWYLQNFHSIYDAIHVHLVLLICPLGLIFNILNIIVLNFLLTLLALSDGTIMALYIVFDLKYLKNNELDSLTLDWAHYLLFYLSMQNILHSFSSWNLVALSVFRLIYIRYPHNAIVHCTMVRAKTAGSIIIMVSIIISVPYILAHKVTFRLIPNPSNSSNINESFKQYYIHYVNSEMETIIFLWTSVFVKSLPITLMTILTITLILALRQSVIRRKTLLNFVPPKHTFQNSLLQSPRSNILHRRGGITKDTIGHVDPVGAKKSIKTTRMLIFIVIIYCFSYLPQVHFL